LLFLLWALAFVLKGGKARAKVERLKFLLLQGQKFNTIIKTFYFGDMAFKIECFTLAFAFRRRTKEKLNYLLSKLYLGSYLY
jgi:hypothetical protein